MNDCLMDLNRYAYNLLSKFNDGHRTSYSCKFGIVNGDMAGSELDTYSHIITIDLPANKISGLTKIDGITQPKIEALKILIGHLVSHHIYQNLDTSVMSNLFKATSRGQGLLRACCIETAADLHGVRFYTELTGHRPDKAALTEYAYLVAPSVIEDTVAYSIREVQGGALPFFMRVTLIKKYASFKTNKYEIVREIATYINMVTKKATGRTVVSREDIIRLSATFEIDNFPTRVNRIRRR